MVTLNSSSNFSLGDAVQDPSRDVGKAVRPEGLEEAVGYSDGFEQAVSRFSLMLVAGFTGLTLNLVASTLVEREKKIPLISEKKSDEYLPKIQDFGFWLGYATVSIMFFIHTIGYGVVIQEVR